MTKKTIRVAAVCALAMLGSSAAFAQDSACGTVGSGGAAATDSTSAATLGTAGACTGTDGGSATLGTGGSSAAVDGKVRTRTHIVDNPNQLKGMSRARAQDGGEWSRSKTKTKVAKEGGKLTSTTRTMSHVPGSAPEKSTSSAQTDLSPSQQSGSASDCLPEQTC